ncbi:Folliculin [Toxocara canis]|uniref:Folliculin n=1 Tax=Toxocara canis TaxID=6265 RepID=A0A0B2VIH2_TOXCA|nr:Folliculin [Toxocara canis]
MVATYWSVDIDSWLRYNLLGCPMSLKVPADAGDVVVASVVLDEETDSTEIPSGSSFLDECSSPLPHSSSSFMDAISQPEETTNVSLDVSCSHGSSFVLQDFARCRIVRVSAPATLLAPSSMPAIVTRYKQLLLDNELGNRVLEAVLKNTREQWLSKSKLIYQLSRQKESIDLTKDAPVLRFWQAGLSKTYKQHVLNTINSYQQVRLAPQLILHGGLRFPVVLDRLSNQPPDFTGPQLERLRCEETTLTATFSGHYGK